MKTLRFIVIISTSGGIRTSGISVTTTILMLVILETVVDLATCKTVGFHFLVKDLMLE